MQFPLTQAAQDLDLLPDPNAEMDEQKKRRLKDKGTAADDNPSSYGDQAFSAAAMELLKGPR